jgi:hypothetical protein
MFEFVKSLVHSGILVPYHRTKLIFIYLLEVGVQAELAHLIRDSRTVKMVIAFPKFHRTDVYMGTPVFPIDPALTG